MEEEYAVRLMNYINGQSQWGILALAFTKRDKFKDYVKEHSLDLVLKGEELDIKDYDGKVVNLCKEEGRDGIYKYQLAREIILEIQQCLESRFQVQKVEKKEKESDIKCKMIGVYSPVGRSGKTSLALALAKGEKNLYIGMEDYSDIVEGRTTMSDFCYWIRKKEEMIVRKVVEQMIFEDDVYKLVSPITYMDLKELNVEEYRWFFEKIKQSGRFQKIVADIGVGSLCSYSFLALFDDVYVPILGNTNVDDIKDIRDIGDIKNIGNISNISNLETIREKEKHFKKILEFTGLSKTDTNFKYVTMSGQDFRKREVL